MLNELITWVLNTYLGKYLEDFNPAQLSVALASGRNYKYLIAQNPYILLVIFKGEVELENVPIRKDALRSFGMPVETMSGTIGRIKLQIPVRQFRSSPWSIVIERVYGVFGPKDLSEWESDKEKEAEYEYKLRILDGMEATWRIDNGCHTESYYSLSYASWVNYGASLVTNILENLELKINDVHLRYEDTVTTPSSPLAAGVRIGSISAQSCDSSWIPGAKNLNSQTISFKLLELKDLNLYWDKLNSDNTCSQLSSKGLLEKMNAICSIDRHQFLTSTVHATAKFRRERCKQPIRTKNRPRISCEVVLPEINIFLSDVSINIFFKFYKIFKIMSFCKIFF